MLYNILYYTPQKCMWWKWIIMIHYYYSLVGEVANMHAYTKHTLKNYYQIKKEKEKSGGVIIANTQRVTQDHFPPHL